MTNTNIPDTAVNNLTDESEATVQPVDGYMPTFGDNVRTIITLSRWSRQSSAWVSCTSANRQLAVSSRLPLVC